MIAGYFFAVGFIMVIYIDILIILNIFINFLILLCSAKLLREIISKPRLVFACIFGGVFSLVLLLPDMGVFVSVLLKIIGAAALSLIAFPLISFKKFLRSFFCILFIGFAFAGIMFALYILIKPDNMAFNNGTVYFEISVRVFVICACICYVLIKLFLYLLKRFSADDRLCTLTVEISGKSVVLKGLVDTGNSLTDVFTGKPVTTVERVSVKRITDGIDAQRRGIVPVKTALGSGMLETVRADRMIIDYNGRRISVLSPIIALSENELSGADYFALVNPDIFEIGRNENEKIKNSFK